MKILLVTMSIEDRYRFKHHKNAPYSLGLGYLHSYIESNGYITKTLFLNDYDYDEASRLFFDEIESFEPDVVSFQVFTMTRTSTFRTIERISSMDKDIRVVVGGIHATVCYQQIIEKYHDVIVVLGEGEITFLELLMAIQNGISLCGIKGIAFYDDSKIPIDGMSNIRVTETRDMIHDLDILPFPKHSVYFQQDPDRTIAHMITSRGCPFKCSFCALDIISKRMVRKRSVNNVIEEIKELKKNYPKIKHIQFHDDTMLLDNHRMIELCKRIIDNDFGLTYECSTRVKPVSYELFDWMEKAGFTKVMFGLESGSQKLLDGMNKKITQKDVVNLFNILKDFNFEVTTFLIVGFPGEDQETIQETISLLHNIQRLHYNLITGVGPLWVYPGTEIYESAKLSGIINDDYWMSDASVPFYTVEYSEEELMEFADEILDSVSLYRIFTINGFKRHFLIMPSVIILYLIRHPIHLAVLLKNQLKKTTAYLASFIRM